MFARRNMLFVDRLEQLRFRVIARKNKVKDISETQNTPFHKAIFRNDSIKFATKMKNQSLQNYHNLQIEESEKYLHFANFVKKT